MDAETLESRRMLTAERPDGTLYRLPEEIPHEGPEHAALGSLKREPTNSTENTEHDPEMRCCG
jgi:hypothetical protein